MTAEEYRTASLQRADEVVQWVQLASATVLVLGTALLLVITAVAVKELWSR